MTLLSGGILNVMVAVNSELPAAQGHTDAAMERQKNTDCQSAVPGPERISHPRDVAIESAVAQLVKVHKNATRQSVIWQAP